MNKVILMGRLTRDPEVRYSQGERQMAIARYTLAVDRRGRNAAAGEQTADFLTCIAFDKAAEFAEKYFHQGTKLIVTGRIQTGSYTNKDGQKEKIIVCKAIQDIMDKSRQEGRAEGEQKQAMLTVLRMYAKGKSLDEIADDVGFDVETVKSWILAGNK